MQRTGIFSMLAQAVVQNQGQALFQPVQADGPEWDVHVVVCAFDDQPVRRFGEAHQGPQQAGLPVDDLLSLTITWRSDGRLPVPSSGMMKSSVYHARLGRLRSGRVVGLGVWTVRIRR